MVIETNNKDMWLNLVKKECKSFVDLFGNESNSIIYYEVYLCGNAIEDVYICNINENELEKLKKVWE